MLTNDLFPILLAAAAAFGAIAFAQMMFHRAILGRRGFFNTRRR
jgi:hypothetical protein